MIRFPFWEIMKFFLKAVACFLFLLTLAIDAQEDEKPSRKFWQILTQNTGFVQKDKEEEEKEHCVEPKPGKVYRIQVARKDTHDNEKVQFQSNISRYDPK